MGYTKINTIEITANEIKQLEEYLKNNGMRLECTPWEIAVWREGTLERVARSTRWSAIKEATGFNKYICEDEMVD
jgi:hypothetical protein